MYDTIDVKRTAFMNQGYIKRACVERRRLNIRLHVMICSINYLLASVNLEERYVSNRPWNVPQLEGVWCVLLLFLMYCQLEFN